MRHTLPHLLHRIKACVARTLHHSGFGVQSPTDYYLVMQVMYEKYPYYAYQQLAHKYTLHKPPCYRRGINELLLRLSNHFQPTLMCEVGGGNGAAADYLKAGCRKLRIVRADVEGDHLRLYDAPNKRPQFDAAHIGFTPAYREAFEQLLPLMQPRAILLIADVHGDRNKARWWREVRQRPEVTLTFDLYELALVVFDPKRIKQNYKINF